MTTLQFEFVLRYLQFELPIKNKSVNDLNFDYSRYLFVRYAPKNVAPGLSMKVVIELRAFVPARIENIIEIRCKAHVIKVPVSARVVTPQEYDRLDAESVMVQGKRILSERNNKQLMLFNIWIVTYYT
jgi:hypothetical protein